MSSDYDFISSLWFILTEKSISIISLSVFFVSLISVFSHSLKFNTEFEMNYSKILLAGGLFPKTPLNAFPLNNRAFRENQVLSYIFNLDER